MSQKTTIILLIVLALIVGYVAMWKFGWLGPSEQKKETSRLDQTLIENPPLPGQVVAISLEHPDRSDSAPLSAEYKNGGWNLLAPAKFRAQSGPLDKIITGVSALRVVAVYKPGEAGAPSEERAGLKTPKAVLVMTNKSGTTYRLTVGRLDPLVHGRTYVRLGDDKTIYTVDADVLASLDLAPEKLRSLDLWTMQASDIKQITISGPKGQTTLNSTPDGWTVNVRPEKGQPFDVAADSSAVGKITEALAGLKAQEWVSEKPSADDLRLFGLDKDSPSLMQVKLTAAIKTPPATQAADTPMAIDLGLAVIDSQYARIPGRDQVFKVAKSAVDSLTVAVKDLRDKRLAPVSAGDIIGLTLTPDNGPAVKLVKKDGHWQMTMAALETAADDKLVGELVDKIVALKADSFEDNPSALQKQSLAKPRLKIEIARDGKPPLIVLVGPKSPLGATTLVGRDALPSVAEVQSSQLEGVLVEPLTLADKKVWDLKRDDIVRIERTSPAGKRVVARDETPAANWQLVEPVKMDADSDAIKGLLDKFVSLTAKQQTLLSAKDAGIDKPAATLVFTVTEDKPVTTQPATSQPAKTERVAVRHTLTLAGKDTLIYAQVDGKGTVYQLDSSLLADATGELARRALLAGDDRPGAAAADLLSLNTSAGEVELVRQGDSWKLRKDANVPVETTKVQEVINSVGGLSVVHYVDFACKDLAKYGLDKPAATATIRVPAPATASTTKPDTVPPRVVTIIVSAKAEEGSFYAVVQGDTKIGLLNPGELMKIQKDWTFFKKSETPSATPSYNPSGPGFGPQD